MTKILIISILAGVAMLPVTQADIIIHAKLTFDGKNSGLIPVKHKNIIYFFPEIKESASKPYIYAQTYPRGSKRRRLKLNFTSKHTFGGKGQALTFEPAIGNETILICSGMNDAPKKCLTAKKDLWVAFCLYTEKNTGSYFLSFWNRTKKKGRKLKLTTTPGKWQVIKQRIYGPNFFDAGDEISSISIYNTGTMKRNWIIDNFVVWQGDDKTPPTEVSGVSIKKSEGLNIISWEPSADNLFVGKYKIYRGSITGFPLNKSSFIGESNTLCFQDRVLMRSDYFYKIVAEDVVGNLSKPSSSVKSD